MEQQKDLIWHSQNITQRPNANKQTSEQKLKQYFRQSNLKNIEDFLILKKQMISLLPPEIEYDQSEHFIKNLAIKIVRHTKNFDLVDIQARLGYFKLKKISIITMDRVSPLHNLCFNSSGNFGSVFNVSYKGIPLAFKCFSKPKPNDEGQQQKKNILKNVIQQYCILKIASALGFGPKIYDQIGCNIIVYSNCIQFSMELCTKFGKDNKFQSLNKNLKENLACLHSLHIIHSDLKFQNICYSHKFQKYVFIDFGFSSIIEEKIGFKTLSTFKGSFTHCSDQMIKLFHSKQQNYIDLYYNDLHSLQLLLNDLKYIDSVVQFQQNQQKDHQKIVQIPQITSEISLSQIKYSLFHMQSGIIQNKISKISSQNLRKLIIFVPNLLVSSKINNIYNVFAQKYELLGDIQQISLIKFQYEKTRHQQRSEKGEVQKNFNFINSINVKNHSIEYYLNNYEKNSQQLFELLRDVQKITKIPFIQYALLLAKAIQINSNRLNLVELNILCQIAIKKRSFFDQLKEKLIIQQKFQFKYLCSISRVLFKKSIEQKLKNNYFDVFCWTITNVIVLHVFEQGQLISYFEEFLKIQLKFQKKIRSILKFNTSLVWLQIISAQWSQFQKISSKINVKIDLYIQNKLKHCHYSDEQIEVLMHILQRQKINAIKQDILSPKRIEKMVDRKLVYQIMQWQLFKQFYCYQYNKYREFTIWDLLYYSQQLSFGSYYICQYYQIFLLIYYIIHKQYRSVQTILKKITYGLKIQNNHSNYLNSIKTILLLKKKNYYHQQIQLFLDSKHIKNNNFPLINKIIEQELVNIHIRYQQQFNLCSKRHKRQFFHYWLLVRTKSWQTFGKKSAECQYQNAINRVIIERKVLNEYYNNIYEKMNISTFSSQDYQSLKNKIKKQGRYQIQLIPNNVLNRQIMLIIVLFMRQQKYERALQVCYYFHKTNMMRKDENANKRQIMQVIITDVINQIKITKDNQIKQEYRSFFFEYANLIQKSKCQQLYLFKIGIFIDVLQLMYKYKAEQILPLINNLSKKFYIFNSRNNTEAYIEAIQLVFRRNLHLRYFGEVNLQFYYSKKLWQNPYNIIFAFYIFRFLKYNFKISHVDKLLKLFYTLKYCNSTIHRRFKQKLLFFYIQFFQKYTTRRKLMKIYKKILKSNKLGQIRIETINLLKLLIDKQSMRCLRCVKHISKYNWLKNKLSLYTQSLQNNKQNYIFKLVCEYNRIVDIYPAEANPY